MSDISIYSDRYVSRVRTHCCRSRETVGREHEKWSGAGKWYGGNLVSTVLNRKWAKTVNSCDQLFWSEKQKGGISSEKEGLKTSISICNQLLHPARQKGRERSPEGETCTLDIHISTEAWVLTLEGGYVRPFRYPYVRDLSPCALAPPTFLYNPILLLSLIFSSLLFPAGLLLIASNRPYLSPLR